jgi:hypothetical protein
MPAWRLDGASVSSCGIGARIELLRKIVALLPRKPPSLLRGLDVV